MPQYRELPSSEAQYLLAHARILGPAPLRLRPKSTSKPNGSDAFAQHADAPAVAVKATVAVRPIVNMKVLGKVRRLPDCLAPGEAAAEDARSGLWDLYLVMKGCGFYAEAASVARQVGMGDREQVQGMGGRERVLYTLRGCRKRRNVNCVCGG